MNIIPLHFSSKTIRHPYFILCILGITSFVLFGLSTKYLDWHNDKTSAIIPLVFLVLFFVFIGISTIFRDSYVKLGFTSMNDPNNTSERSGSQ